MDIIPTKALVVLSGGQDSTTCMFWAKSKFDEVHAVTFDYGQRHHREVQAADKVAHMAGCKTHELIKVPNILRSASPLTSSASPLETYSDAEQMAEIIGDRIEKTFVPMRNPLFLVLAVNRAIALGFLNVVTGVCQEDNANYPDCTEQFIDRFQAMTNEALGLAQSDTQVVIHTPLMHLSKAETVMLAHDLAFDLSMNAKTKQAWEALAWTHTAYSGEYPPITQDHATVLRAKGFADAGLPDPLILRAVSEGRMHMPGSSNYDQARALVAEIKEKEREAMVRQGADGAA